MLILLHMLYLCSEYLWSCIVNRNQLLDASAENEINSSEEERNYENDTVRDKKLLSSPEDCQSEVDGFPLGDTNLETDPSNCLDRFSFHGSFEEFNQATYDFETKKIRFFPPVYVQRYITVANILKDERWRDEIKKVIDIGCSELGFFRFLKDVTSLEKILEIDIDKKTLQEYSYRIQPWATDYLKTRNKDLEVTLLCGNAARPDRHLEGVDAVVAIELIEHLHPPELEELPRNIFGVVRPRIAIFTTPNEEFNVLFDNFSGFRHYDHKFEWKRSEFESWAKNICVTFPNYEVSFFGIGPGPEGNEKLGCCSQGAVFVRTNSSLVDSLSIVLSNYEEYEVIDSVVFPENNDPRSQDTITFDDAKIFLHLCNRTGDYFNGERTEIPLGAVLMRVYKTCQSLEKLKQILELDFKIEKDKDGDYIVILPECDRFSEDDSLSDHELDNIQYVVREIDENDLVTDDWDNIEPDGTPWIIDSVTDKSMDSGGFTKESVEIDRTISACTESVDFLEEDSLGKSVLNLNGDGVNLSENCVQGISGLTSSSYSYVQESPVHEDGIENQCTYPLKRSLKFLPADCSDVLVENKIDMPYSSTSRNTCNKKILVGETEEEIEISNTFLSPCPKKLIPLDNNKIEKSEKSYASSNMVIDSCGYATRRIISDYQPSINYSKLNSSCSTEPTAIINKCSISNFSDSEVKPINKINEEFDLKRNKSYVIDDTVNSSCNVAEDKLMEDIINTLNPNKIELDHNKYKNLILPTTSKTLISSENDSSETMGSVYEIDECIVPVKEIIKKFDGVCVNKKKNLDGSSNSVKQTDYDISSKTNYTVPTAPLVISDSACFKRTISNKNSLVDDSCKSCDDGIFNADDHNSVEFVCDSNASIKAIDFVCKKNTDTNKSINLSQFNPSSAATDMTSVGALATYPFCDNSFSVHRSLLKTESEDVLPRIFKNNWEQDHTLLCSINKSNDLVLHEKNTEKTFLHNSDKQLFSYYYKNCSSVPSSHSQKYELGDISIKDNESGTEPVVDSNNECYKKVEYNSINYAEDGLLSKSLLFRDQNVEEIIKTYEFESDLSECKKNEISDNPLDSFNIQAACNNFPGVGGKDVKTCDKNFDKMFRSHSLGHVQYSFFNDTLISCIADSKELTSNDHSELPAKMSIRKSDEQKKKDENIHGSNNDGDDDSISDLVYTGMERQDSFSPDKAGDSGYPNSNSGRDMEMDLTPEQVKEIMTEGESSLENSPLDSPVEEVPVAFIPHPPVLHLGDNVENGDVANNNRDGEGNNMIGQAAIVGEPLEFLAVIDQPQDMPLMAVAEHNDVNPGCPKNDCGFNVKPQHCLKSCCNELGSTKSVFNYTVPRRSMSFDSSRGKTDSCGKSGFSLAQKESQNVCLLKSDYGLSFNDSNNQNNMESSLETNVKTEKNQSIGPCHLTHEVSSSFSDCDEVAIKKNELEFNTICQENCFVSNRLDDSEKKHVSNFEPAKIYKFKKENYSLKNTAPNSSSPSDSYVNKKNENKLKFCSIEKEHSNALINNVPLSNTSSFVISEAKNNFVCNVENGKNHCIDTENVSSNGHHIQNISFDSTSKDGKIELLVNQLKIPHDFNSPITMKNFKAFIEDRKRNTSDITESNVKLNNSVYVNVDKISDIKKSEIKGSYENSIVPDKFVSVNQESKPVFNNRLRKNQLLKGCSLFDNKSTKSDDKLDSEFLTSIEGNPDLFISCCTSDGGRLVINNSKESTEENRIESDIDQREDPNFLVRYVSPHGSKLVVVDSSKVGDPESNTTEDEKLNLFVSYVRASGSRLVIDENDKNIPKVESESLAKEKETFGTILNCVTSDGSRLVVDNIREMISKEKSESASSNTPHCNCSVNTDTQQVKRNSFILKECPSLISIDNSTLCLSGSKLPTSSDQMLKLVESETGMNLITLSSSELKNWESYRMVESYDVADLKKYAAWLAHKSSNQSYNCIMSSSGSSTDSSTVMLKTNSIPSCSNSTSSPNTDFLSQSEITSLQTSEISTSEASDLCLPENNLPVPISFFDDALNSVVQDVVEELLSPNLEPFADWLLQIQLELISIDGVESEHVENGNNNRLRNVVGSDDNLNNTDSELELIVQADVKGGGDSSIDP